jgi:hypothetical protein
MTIQVIMADRGQHASQIRELFWEYLQWANSRLQEEYEISFDIASILEGDMKDLGKFMPPQGCLLLAYAGKDLAGIGSLHPVSGRSNGCTCVPAIGRRD